MDLGALDNHENPPLVSPELIRSRVGTIRVGSNKTLFSARGATVRHGTLDLDGSRNVILRNLRFRGLWEWDEATRGEYDRQGWDFVVLRGARNVWIDHCDFGKAYDGPLDIVRGSDLVTVSWTRFAGDTDGEVERQLAHLEASTRRTPPTPASRTIAPCATAGRRRKSSCARSRSRRATWSAVPTAPAPPTTAGST